MQRQHRTLALAGAAVLALVVGTGCGGRDARAGGDTANEPASSAGPGAALIEPAASPSPAATQPPNATLSADAAATRVPAPQTTPAPPTAAPFVAPDLTAIERLLDDLDAALGADATAESDEGSYP